MDEIYVRCVVMPADVKGFTLPGADGYNVYINDLLSQEDRIRAYEHELKHIQQGDFGEGDVQEIESATH